MKKIGLVVKMTNPDAVKLAADVAEWLMAKGADVYGDDMLADEVAVITPAGREDLADTVDAMVVLGGDGTMLYAARLIRGKKVPILGANMGGLGFLTAIKVEELYANLERVVNDNFETEERMMLEVNVIRDGSSVATYNILNDVAIKGKVARLVKLETSINNEYVTTFRVDGLIIATPTGSTAYALSASGPILYPTIHSIIVVPICPFNLTNRPVVIPDWMEVEATIDPTSPETDLTLDGQIDFRLKGNDTIKVKRAAESVYLVKCEGKGYFDILRERLAWEGRKE